MDLSDEESPATWLSPSGEAWYFEMIDLPFVEKGVVYGSDFVWLRVDPDKGLPPGFRRPSIAGFRTAPPPDQADWWKSE